METKAHEVCSASVRVKVQKQMIIKKNDWGWLLQEEGVTAVKNKTQKKAKRKERGKEKDSKEKLKLVNIDCPIPVHTDLFCIWCTGVRIPMVGQLQQIIQGIIALLDLSSSRIKP